MSTSKLCILLIFQKPPKIGFLYTYARSLTKGLKLHPKAIFHKTKTLAPIAVYRFWHTSLRPPFS